MADKRKYADRRAELIKAVAKRRRKIKLMAIEYKGGQCQICRYDKYPKGLDLHHVDPKTKEFGIASKGYTRSWEKVKTELDKCILVCANCHRELEAGITQLPWETKDEKQGEIGETLNRQSRLGNTEPSLISLYKSRIKKV
ncbi:MAG: HNH endonuclease [Candidatus Staskawiczbacteria bacterium]|nr:HNH endonuclease [Candidatus Staskawiczbacteria bacterium]